MKLKIPKPSDEVMLSLASGMCAINLFCIMVGLVAERPWYVAFNVFLLAWNGLCVWAFGDSILRRL